jgi:hypothetical protein
MKGWPVWASAIAFVALTAQCMASPPVTLPKGPILPFTTETLIECDGTVRVSENYYWAYYEGQGNLSASTSGADAEGHPIIITPGFQETAAISYEQDFTAINGRTTLYKSLALDPNKAPNLYANMIINFEGDTATGSAVAIHNEKVGLTVISVGADHTAGNPGSGLLSLCPWAAAQGGGSSGGGYPAHREGIAAESSFKVTNIQGFSSESIVISTDDPFFKYSVDTLSGEGFISAGFVVELWEGVTKWGSHDIGIHNAGQVPTGTYAIDCPPSVASRTSYSEQATADGVWKFRKIMSYQSTIPKTNLIYQVP